MSASLLIKKAAAEGVSVKLENDNKLKACGPAEARAKWLPILREHKSELLAELAGSDRQDRQDRHSAKVGKACGLTTADRSKTPSKTAAPLSKRSTRRWRPSASGGAIGMRSPSKAGAMAG